jgi:hypothetical protein
MAKEMRLRRRINVKEAVDAKIQVQVRSGIDLYLQMAKEMRLRRRSNVKECVMTGDLNNVQNVWMRAAILLTLLTRGGYPSGCRLCASK